MICDILRVEIEVEKYPPPTRHLASGSRNAGDIRRSRLSCA
nr:MAG TPA: hypothetical protein [Caudoviricetes sp.]DAP06305.1 MAG TPA: hypothetical protein [Caudoviricetes sp.]DAX18925.1 MAG TPA: hypothetical protein [Bacteriophage sp.]DAX31889.1 MAG TPA: hypothetical protein [Caudoviricetes sp.]